MGQPVAELHGQIVALTDVDQDLYLPEWVGRQLAGTVLLWATLPHKVTTRAILWTNVHNTLEEFGYPEATVTAVTDLCWQTFQSHRLNKT